MKEKIDQIIKQHGLLDYKWIIPQKDIIISRWVRFHCEFGCDNYGKNGSCPPAVPSVDECRQMIYEYQNAVMFHFTMRSEDRELQLKRLLNFYEMEREIFLSGYYKVFLLQYNSCFFCGECPAKDNRINCINKIKSRPEPAAFGIDVFQTAHNVGYQVQVVNSFDDTINRFGFLLID